MLRDHEPIGRLHRMATMLGARVLPIGLMIAVIPPLHSAAAALVVLLYAAWAAGEAWIENPTTNRAARSSPDDRGTRSMVLGAHLASIVLPLLERAVDPIPSSPAWMAAGALMFCAGTALRIGAVVALGPSFTAHVQTRADQTICRHGPYRHVRHPSYLGLFLLNVSASVVLAAPLSGVFAAVISAASIARRVAVEEQALIAAFGAEYQAYRRAVPKYLPAPKWLRLAPASGRSSGG